MSNNQKLLIVCSLLALSSCDRKGTDYLPQPVGDYPSVLDIGSLGIMTKAQFEEFRQMRHEGLTPPGEVATDEGTAFVSPLEWCRDPANFDADGNPVCYFGQVSGSVSGVGGGAPAQLAGPPMAPAWRSIAALPRGDHPAN